MHFGGKAHITVDADSGLVHTVTTTANEADEVADLLYGREDAVWPDAGYGGAGDAGDAECAVAHCGAAQGLEKMPRGRAKARARENEYEKTSVRAKIRHPLRLIKRQFRLVKVRFERLAQSTAYLITLFALSNL